ncbi:hypothetical protein D9758_013009 [Tetrapyrgos nigripes]|uniref:Major facilitator superfamily (MFS) profile domain-containing protein n=1 Tax=Tetrapyrgos nigripes TaxID=182062 RepID=A0A8H5C9D9_9AGAR|nr:hypothetical protein D9758_013009 [Tetrapyrgos nigripes]
MATLNTLPSMKNDEDTKPEHPRLSNLDSSAESIEYPEGGLEAWLVIFGSFLALFATWGVINSYGVFHDYYSTVLLPNSSSSTISLIGALQLFFLYGFSPVVGRIFDLYGSRILLPLGSIITVISLMLLSLCQVNQTYQFFLADGLLFGIGATLVFTPAVAVAGHWFNKKRPLAIGVMATGSSVGGVVCPIILQRLIPKVGFGWAVRVMAFVVLGCLILSCVTIKTRLLPRSRLGLVDVGAAGAGVGVREAGGEGQKGAWRSGLVDLTGFKDPKFCLACAATFILFYVLFIPFFYIEAYAKYRQVDSTISQYVVAIMNGAAILRLSLCFLAVKYGTVNIIVPSILVSGILVLAVWLPSRGAVPIAVFGSLYAIFSGVFITLLPAWIGAMSTTERFGGRVGCVWFFAAVASLVGTPTAGAFVKDREHPGYNSLMLFTGVMFLGGSVILVIARILHSRRLWYKI